MSLALAIETHARTIRTVTIDFFIQYPLMLYILDR